MTKLFIKMLNVFNDLTLKLFNFLKINKNLLYLSTVAKGTFHNLFDDLKNNKDMEVESIVCLFSLKKIPK